MNIQNQNNIGLIYMSNNNNRNNNNDPKNPNKKNQKNVNDPSNNEVINPFFFPLHGCNRNKNVKFPFNNTLDNNNQSDLNENKHYFNMTFSSILDEIKRNRDNNKTFEVIINDDQNDLNFRVEGLGTDNFFLLDASSLIASFSWVFDLSPGCLVKFASPPRW